VCGIIENKCKQKKKKNADEQKERTKLDSLLDEIEDEVCVCVNYELRKKKTL
jgi:hypothetical protein